MKANIVYYSNTNNTAKVAEGLRQGLLTKAWEIEVVRLQPAKETGMLSQLYRTLAGGCVPVNPIDVSLASYDLVFLGTPVWARNPTPYINQFIEQNDWEGKQVALFVTMQGSGDRYVLDKLERRLVRKGGNVIKSFSLAIGKNITHKHIQRAIEFGSELDI